MKKTNGLYAKGSVPIEGSPIVAKFESHQYFPVDRSDLPNCQIRIPSIISNAKNAFFVTQK